MSEQQRAKRAPSASEFTIPILDATDAVQWMSDALDQALTERKGVAVVGYKGTGKSIALADAIAGFEAQEPANAEKEQRAERRVRKLQSPSATDKREVLVAIHQAIFGMEPELRARGGRTRGYDVLLPELVELLLSQDIAVLVFEEAENLKEEGVEVARDLVSMAEAKGEDRRFTEQGIRAFGVGVLFVGTPKLIPPLRASAEVGQRWVRIQEIGDLNPERAAAVYRAYLPAFERRARELGARQWRDFVRIRVAKGGAMPIRHIENHTRSYVRSMLAEFPETDSFEAIGFDEEIFFSTLNALPRSSAA